MTCLHPGTAAAAASGSAPRPPRPAGPPGGAPRLRPHAPPPRGRRARGAQLANGPGERGRGRRGGPGRRRGEGKGAGGPASRQQRRAPRGARRWAGPRPRAVFPARAAASAGPRAGPRRPLRGCAGVRRSRARWARGRPGRQTAAAPGEPPSSASPPGRRPRRDGAVTGSGGYGTCDRPGLTADPSIPRSLGATKPTRLPRARSVRADRRPPPRVRQRTKRCILASPRHDLAPPCGFPASLRDAALAASNPSPSPSSLLPPRLPLP